MLFTAAFMYCGGPGQKYTAQTSGSSEVALDTEQEQEQMLMGLQTRTALQQAPYDSWFGPQYEEYSPDTALMEKLKPLTDDIEITIFMGTWCHDSQHEVPSFFKLLDQLGVPDRKVTLITVDREKTTGENLEKGLDITNVPTLIFSKNGKELNRIVEFPIDSLEEDMYKILSGEEYKHAYAW